METIQFNGSTYPKFQSEGFASKFAFPFAMQVCKGNGLDIGCGKTEWCLPGAFPIDPKIPLYNHKNELEEWDAMDLPEEDFDYIFSSHCLEHLPHWVYALDYWVSKIKHGGTLFLYLPDFSQEYWRPWNNRKHIHCFTPEILSSYLKANENLKNVFVSGVDMNNSFMCMAEKV